MKNDPAFRVNLPDSRAIQPSFSSFPSVKLSESSKSQIFLRGLRVLRGAFRASRLGLSALIAPARMILSDYESFAGNWFYAGSPRA